MYHLNHLHADIFSCMPIIFWDKCVLWYFHHGILLSWHSLDFKILINMILNIIKQVVNCTSNLLLILIAEPARFYISYDHLRYSVCNKSYTQKKQWLVDSVSHIRWRAYFWVIIQVCLQILHELKTWSPQAIQSDQSRLFIMHVNYKPILVYGSLFGIYK